MILAYVTMGIANLKSGAGKLLLITVAIAYCSTLIAGSASFFVADTLFPHFMSADALDKIAATAGNSLEPYFSLEIPALMNTLSAVVTAFVLGLCMSSLRGKTIGDTLYNGVSDFSGIIDCVLHKVIIPLLPLYICGTFTDMTKSGKTFAILGILWKVFIVVIIMHLICICIQFVIAGLVSHKNPFTLIRNQIPGYATALGTQSSAATIPVNLQCAEADGVSSEIRNFTVPLCANIHMAGSMITITACATAVCLMNQLPISLGTVIPFIMTLGVGTVIQGVFLIYTKGAPKGNASPLLKAICGQSFIGILSGIVVIWAVMAAVTIVLLRNTPYGRKIYSVGTNEQAARFSGIHTGRVTFSVYLISAVIAAVSGFFLVGYTGTSFLDVGTSYNTKTIAAVIIGGTAITGGKGGYIGTIAGAIIMTILDDFLTIVNIPEAGRQIMQGVIIVLLVLIYSREKHKK